MRATRMAHQSSSLAFTDDVAAVQREMGSRNANEKPNDRGPANDTFSEFEKDFISRRDGFYISTVGKTGWPYIQFRGGPTGFLHVLDDRTLAYADITGNRQYITTGNLRSNDRAALFLMDYAHQGRLKILGHVKVLPWKEAPDWKSQLKIPQKDVLSASFSSTSPPLTGTARRTSPSDGPSKSFKGHRSSNASANSKTK